MHAPSVLSLEKGLLLLDEISRGGEDATIEVIADRAGIAVSTAYRIAATLVRHGFLVRPRRGRYSLGPAVLRLAGPQPLRSALAACARPVLRALARDTNRTAHLGIYEDEMVTYLVKESPKGAVLFTREGMQHEAYCSAIGKVLLAHLSDDEFERYLSGGPFIALTENTIVEPARLRAEIDVVRRAGYALDNAEVDAQLRCIAVAVRDDEGRAVAALSLASSASDTPENPKTLLDRLVAASEAIEQRVFKRAEASS